ncbi:MAG TPA: hypothetical protein VD969_25175 [Symbiobacteriaceae bacterium]|nr:hypothetical protein [Symbiobacteriaceae bacterium]
MANEKTTVDFSQTMTQKILYSLLPLALAVVVVFLSPMIPGIGGTIAVLVFGIPLGLVTYFVSAAWAYKLELTPSEILINDRRVITKIPMDKVGMVVRNGGFPFPTLWVITRNSGVGHEIPTKKVDPKAQELIEAYRQRNPGKTLTYVAVPGNNLRSVPAFVSELKRRIPPLTVDERLAAK